jgi:dTMP kinase
MSRGVFLAFEGIDASGKSTQARRVAKTYEALFTFEPGDTTLGAQLRTWLLDATLTMTPQSEALLMLADRAQHVATVIEPALAAGRSVVTDRFAASTLAYQGYGRGVNLDELMVATNLAVGSCTPDLTILLDVPTDVAASRRTKNNADRFESANQDFHERVREGFLSLAARNAQSWLVIDGTQSEDVVGTLIDQRVATLAWP